MADEAMTQMTKARFLETLRERRRQWEDAIAAIGEERMTQPGFAGEWSVRDVVAHITAYERWLLEQIEAAARGEQAPLSVLDDSDMERRNRAAHEQTRALPLDAVMAEARRVWEGLLQIAERSSEADLIEPARAPAFVRKGWGESAALWQGIANLTYEHYDEHLPDFAAWADKPASMEA
jgi:uncharacterized damage-inducible protein DinB